MTEHAWSRQEFEQKLREKGAYYHIHHPFHKRMNEGHCSVDEIQGWVATDCIIKWRYRLKTRQF